MKIPKVPLEDGALLKGLLVGIVVGGTAAWLLAPYSGQQLRALIQEHMLHMKVQAEDTLLHIQDDAREKIAKTRTTIQLLLPGRRQK